MSETPETDAEGYGDGRHPWVATEFARKMERERDEAREAIRALAEHGESEIQRITKERDEAREQNAKLRDLAERAIFELSGWDDGKLSSASTRFRAELDQLKEGAK
jgi:gas vesicle protein